MVIILERPGCDIHYVDSGGNGPSVVFLHGAGVDQHMFDPQVEALIKAGYRTVTWDMRGHGQSMLAPRKRFTIADTLDDLHALITQLELKKPILIGHSLGGNLAQAYVKQYPDNVGGMIILDSTWNSGTLTRWEEIQLQIAPRLLRVTTSAKMPGTLARASAVTPEAISKAEGMFSQMPKRTFLDVCYEMISLIKPDPMYLTPVPLSLIRGDLDKTGNIAKAMTQWAHADNVAELIIPNAGHLVTLDAPRETSSVLLQTLRRWSGKDI